MKTPHDKVRFILTNFTSISDTISNAVIMHLCDGISISEATQRSGAKSRATISRAANKVRELQKSLNTYVDEYRYINARAILEEEALHSPEDLYKRFNMTAHAILKGERTDINSDYTVFVYLVDMDMLPFVFDFKYAGDGVWIYEPHDYDCIESIAAEQHALLAIEQKEKEWAEFVETRRQLRNES